MKMVRENFCGMCAVIPIALAGAGATGLATKEEYKQKKMMKLIISAVFIFISLFLLWWYQDCQACKV